MGIVWAIETTMDKFVVRGPPPNHNKEKPKLKKKKKPLTQSTILDAKKVIALEKTKVMIMELQTNKDDPEKILDLLLNFAGKTFEPCVLTELDLISTVRPLTSHENDIVSTKAQELVDKWELRLSQPSKPQIQVRAGGKDERLRRNFRNMFLKQFTKSIPKNLVDEQKDRCKQLTELMEGIVFTMLNNRRVTERYKRVCRKLAAQFSFNNTASKLLDGEISVKSYVSKAVQLIRL
eukprot:m.2138 g.2138  ORF g.2138 m.2138 type:complete len:235 (+) comp1726_c0_seq1:125-829(+)